MIKNLDKNRFWFYTGLELLCFSLYFVYRNNYFEYPPPSRGVLSVLDNTLPVSLLAVAAALTIVYSLWDIRHLHFKQIIVGVDITAVLTYFLAFILRDMDLKMPSFGMLLTGILLARLVHESLRKE
ncbi:hypothetical protein [Lactobacillus acetotolerans]|uniref:hypothetical protein n=1 Tax=Lactobacillus acetotolerans TaxID=1600 RepID=UPI002FDB20B1